jgi:hypothetical protein
MSEGYQALERVLWPAGGTHDVWMIVDAARDRRIFGLLLDCFYSDNWCLFTGRLSPELELAAPYLVRLDYQSAKTRRFLAQAAGRQWGVFLKCSLRLEELRHHLRELLLVQDQSGRQMLFRYFDPRILRIYLPTCTGDELRTVFGDIERFWIEGERPDVMLRAELDRDRLTLAPILMS